MNSDQQVVNTGLRPPTVYDQKYVDFVDNVLKEVAGDFEKEKKCMWLIMPFNGSVQLRFFPTFLIYKARAYAQVCYILSKNFANINTRNIKTD